MKAIVSVIGQDKKGIIAKVSGMLFELGINVEDISQTIMQNKYFTMIMMVDLSECEISLGEVKSKLNELGSKLGVEINLQHEDIFNAMHRL